MKVIANGAEHELREGTLKELLHTLGTPEQGIAVAVDGELVTREAWERTQLPEGARVEIVTAVQGG